LDERIAGFLVPGLIAVDPATATFVKDGKGLGALVQSVTSAPRPLPYLTNGAVAGSTAIRPGTRKPAIRWLAVSFEMMILNVAGSPPKFPSIIVPPLPVTGSGVAFWAKTGTTTRDPTRVRTTPMRRYLVRRFILAVLLI